MNSNRPNQARPAMPTKPPRQNSSPPRASWARRSIRASIPTVATIERETHFNAMNPFYEATFGYGTAVVLLLLSLGFVRVTNGKTSFSGITGSTLYRVGLAGLAAGIALEIYGFYLRVRISSWAPVTNMYETVIWVALFAAVLSSGLRDDLSQDLLGTRRGWAWPFWAQSSRPMFPYSTRASRVCNRCSATTSGCRRTSFASSRAMEPSPWRGCSAWSRASPT